MYSVYAIRGTSVNRIYVGHCNDIERRLKEHNTGYVKSTSSDGHWNVVAIQNTETRDEARWIERRLKRSRGAKIKWLVDHSIREVQLDKELGLER